MVHAIENKLKAIFSTIEIYPEYEPNAIKINRYQWNQDPVDFVVIYYIEQTEYRFHCNPKIAAIIGINHHPLDYLTQLESEVNYVKRMIERGIGSKEYYPCTRIKWFPR